MIRYLRKEEHIKTRKMWEEIFSTDAKEFIDYYYTYKTKNNQIMVVEEDRAEGSLQTQDIPAENESFLAMLQLNPYKIAFKGVQINLHYIVGVATDSLHRHQGHMKNLLHQALKDMYQRQEPFTFLMPAAEAIYTPFDFRFIYRQSSCLFKREVKIEGISGCKEAKKEDIPELVQFSNKLLEERYEIYAYRTTEYYETLLEEVKSENGNIILFYKEKALAGYFFYGISDKIEIREPVCKAGVEKEFVGGILKNFSHSEKDIKLSGFDGGLKNHLEAESNKWEAISETPIIMARIVHFEKFISFFESREPMNITIRIVDPILEGNNKTFQISSRKENLFLQAKETTEEEDVSIDTASLVEWLFGWRDLNSLYDSGLIKVNENMVSELDKLKITNKIFLNEVV